MESNRRIRKDINEGVVRSDVKLDVLYTQYNMYMHSRKQDWKEEGADEAIFI